MVDVSVRENYGFHQVLSITQSHEDLVTTHGGIAITIYRLKIYFYWPQMVKYISWFVSTCNVCKQTKAPNQVLKSPAGQPIISVRPFQTLYLDLLGSFRRSSSGILVLSSFSIICWNITFLDLSRSLMPIIQLFLDKRVFHIFLYLSQLRLTTVLNSSHPCISPCPRIMVFTVSSLLFMLR